VKQTELGEAHSRSIRGTEFKGWIVSTVLLCNGSGFETLVFNPKGQEERELFTSDLEESKQQHNRAVENLIEQLS